MSNKYQNELYEKLSQAFKKNDKENVRKDILKLVPGNTYVVRLIPNMADASKTFCRYYMHGWTSVEDGKYMSAICPTTYEDECPICKEYFKLWNKNTDESRELAKNLKRKKRVYANVYVVDDPTNPENNNTVKILSFGRQLDDIINNGWDGDDKDEVGARMFDFSENGCNLRIKVEKNAGGFPVYTASKFLNPCKITAKLEDIEDQTHDLDTLLKIKTTSELQSMVTSGLYGVPSEPSEAPKSRAKAPTKSDDDDDIPMDFSKKESNEPPVVYQNEDDDDVMAGLDEFLKG